MVWLELHCHWQSNVVRISKCVDKFNPKFLLTEFSKKIKKTVISTKNKKNISTKHIELYGIYFVINSFENYLYFMLGESAHRVTQILMPD